MNRPTLALVAAAFFASVVGVFSQERSKPYSGWSQSGELTLLTTPDGADLPTGAVVENFPALVRLHADWFDFRQTRPNGEDVRFSAKDGTPLAFEIEEWDPQEGVASVWVRIPRIEGNARQAIRLHWGNANAASESNGRAVFNESNGYLSTWHLGDTVRDEVGTLESKDVDTTTTRGVIGKARHLAGNQGVFGGEKITSYPSADLPHTTEAWFRAERSNVTVIGWGNEGGGRGSKVRLQLRSPPHIRVDSDFSDIKSTSRLPLNEWIHVAHVFGAGPRRLYVNGRLDGEATTALNIKNPARLWLGGWYHQYDFVGDLDEVRVSKVARSADWVRLEFENQKPLSTLVGPLVRSGTDFRVIPESASLGEGESVTFRAEIGGAEKIFWLIVADGKEKPIAVDRFSISYAPGRVSGESTRTLRLKAVTAEGVKTKDLPITVRETIAEPAFTLHAPDKWDGRTPIEVTTEIAPDAGDVAMEWAIEPFAVIHESAPGKLILRRAQNSGVLQVTARVSNGGAATVKTIRLAVHEPAHDDWIPRPPESGEKPEDGQFFARDPGGDGTLFYRGILNEAGDSVFLKLYADGRLIETLTAELPPDRSYAFALKLKAGLIRYRVEFGTGDRVLHSADNLVCGDAFLLNGQSNAVATDWGKDDAPAFRSEWIRTFGTMAGEARNDVRWGEATYRAEGGKWQIGYWAMELAKQLVESEGVPICILNGAVGGTRNDQHQRRADQPTDASTIYGRLLARVRAARLTHGVRGILWHQGENDQGADGPTGEFGYENYRALFIALANSWKQDFPNVRHYHVFQIWPKACAMGVDGSDNRLREVQRNLPTAFAKMSIMSTLGIDPPGGCHYPPAGYSEIARLILPLIQRDHYGKAFAGSITPPNLRRAALSGPNEITLHFDQPVKWEDALTNEFYLDGDRGKVVAGRSSGNELILQLAAPTPSKTITYLDSQNWSQKRLLRGENGIAALTFCEVPIER